jgi:hypothetical protein
MEDNKNIRIIYSEEMRGKIPLLNIKINTLKDDHINNIKTFKNGTISQNPEANKINIDLKEFFQKKEK